VNNFETVLQIYFTVTSIGAFILRTGGTAIAQPPSPDIALAPTQNIFAVIMETFDHDDVDIAFPSQLAFFGARIVFERISDKHEIIDE
jgi:hypothetical protein